MGQLRSLWRVNDVVSEQPNFCKYALRAYILSVASCMELFGL